MQTNHSIIDAYRRQRRNEGAEGGSCHRAQQARDAIRSEEKNFEIFRETRVVFAKYIITKIVIWLLNRSGLCLKKFRGGRGHFRIFAPGRQVVTLRR